MRKVARVFVIGWEKGREYLFMVIYKISSEPGARLPQEHFPGASQGMQDAFVREIEARFTAARPRLLRLAHLRGVPPDAIEDVVQETLLEAWKHLERLYAPEGLQFWLDEICRNICRRYARKQATDMQRSVLLSASYACDEDEHTETGVSYLNDTPDSRLPDPIETLSRQDMVALLDRALGSLSEGARDLVEQCYLLELPQREVAARLGLTISALEARLHRARRQLRQALSGPLRDEAQAFGLALDQQSAEGWQETRLWCTLCGQRRLSGLFLPRSDGGVNLHMRCLDCEQRYGLSDVHSSNVHSRGLVSLEDLRAFRPAWKRTMQTRMQQLMKTLASGGQSCPYCGTPSSLRLIDKTQEEREVEGMLLPAGWRRYPYQFWLAWDCAQCGCWPGAGSELFAASDLVYWSHARTRRFMLDHPRWISEPEMLVEHAGQPAIRFQMADLTGAARLTALANRQTLRIISLF